MKDKTKLAIIPSLLLAVTFGICAPIQMYLTNSTELWFSISDIWWVCALVGIVIFGVSLGIAALLPKNLSRLFLCLIFGISLGLYIQGNFVNTDYGVLDGRTIDWSQYTGTAITNTLLWLICLLVPVALYFIRPKLAKKLLGYLILYVIAVQILSLSAMLLTTDLSKDTSGKYLSQRGLFEVAKERNVVVFVLDSYDQKYFEEIYQTEPDFLEPLDGFTYFSNATCMYPTTNGSMPYILTGVKYKNEKPYVEYIRSAFEETDYYRVLKKDGYEVGIYTDGIYVYDNGDIDNLEKKGLVVSSYSGLAKTLYKFTAFRYFPHVSKKFFWFYSGEFDTWQGSSDDGFPVYSSDNIKFYNHLKSRGLCVSDAEKGYKIIHLDGAHLPHNMTEDMVEVSDGNANYMTEAKGSFNIVYEYIRFLKDLDLYDNTTIVITADHGEVSGEPTSPILLVKRAGESGGLKESHAPVCHGDLMATIMTELKLNDNMKFGYSVFDIPENDLRIREYIHYTLEDDSGKKEYLPPMKEYTVDPDDNDVESFHLMDYNVQEYILGTPLSFQEENTAKPYCIAGMSPNEGAYTWTSGRNAVFAFQLNCIPENDILVTFDIVKVFNGTQTVIASVNGSEVYNHVVQKKGSLTFTIPKELVKNEQLKIEMNFPDACSPLQLGVSDDVRLLAFGLTGMKLEEAIVQPETVSDKDLYELGTQIKFTSDFDGTEYFSGGISVIEQDFAWSDGYSSDITIPCKENVINDIHGTIHLKHLILNAQQLIIRAGDTVLFDEVLTSAEKPVEFTIPAECIDNGVLNLTLEYPDAVCPADLGKSTDQRILSVGFSSIVFDIAG